MYTKMITEPQVLLSQAQNFPVLSLSGQLRLVCVCDCTAFWLPSFSGWELLPLLHFPQYRFRQQLQPVSFLRLNKFFLLPGRWALCSTQMPTSPSLLHLPSHSWWEVEMGSRQSLLTALVTIFTFIGHYWKYLAGCVQNQMVDFSQQSYPAGL